MVGHDRRGEMAGHTESYSTWGPRCLLVSVTWAATVVFLACVTPTEAQNLDRETAESRLCSIEGAVITCPVVSLTHQNLTVLGNVYACTEPVYLQFIVGLSGSPHTSEYTFINEDESQRVRDVQGRVTLHTILHRSDGLLFIKAAFLEPSGNQVYFLETHLDMPDEATCTNADTSAGRILPVALVAVASVVLATAAVLLLMWWYRKRQRCKLLAASELLADMESSPTSVPYQEEPISSEPGRHASTTVIQNSVYRDSVIIDGGLDPIAEEGGGDDSITSPGGGRSHRHKHRGKNGVKSGKKQRQGSNGNRNNAGYRRPPQATGHDLVDVTDCNGAASDINVSKSDKIDSVDSQNTHKTSHNAANNSQSMASNTHSPVNRPNGHMDVSSKSPSNEQTIAKIAPPPQICLSPSTTQRS